MKFESLNPGRLIDAGSYTVTEQEIRDFAQRYDPQWFHTDAERARKSRWRGLIASGWLTCSIAMRLAVEAVLADSESAGSPGVEQIRWPNPLRPGTRVQLRIEVLERRTSSSGVYGIVRWRWTLNSDVGEKVLELIATSLFSLQST